MVSLFLGISPVLRRLEATREILSCRALRLADTFHLFFPSSFYRSVTLILESDWLIARPLVVLIFPFRPRLRTAPKHWQPSSSLLNYKTTQNVNIQHRVKQFFSIFHGFVSPRFRARYSTLFQAVRFFFININFCRITDIFSCALTNPDEEKKNTCMYGEHRRYTQSLYRVPQFQVERLAESFFISVKVKQTRQSPRIILFS